jgi:hypothetical protein
LEYFGIMPRNNIDYSKTIIYKIVCNDLMVSGIYVGSTSNFTRRKTEHKKTCNNNINNKLKLYETIRNNGGWGNWDMIQIEVFPCNDGNEARARERYWYEQLQANLNNNCPFRECKKEYYEENKDRFKELSKEYRDNNKDKIKEYKEAHKDRAKDNWIEYSEKNKDKIKEKQKEYREKNRDEINRKKREKRRSLKTLSDIAY